MTDRPHILLAHHLKTLKLPTFLREYEPAGIRESGAPVRGRGPGSCSVPGPAGAALVHELMEARDERRPLRLQKQMVACTLLIIDESGFVPLSKTGAELLFELISQRYERGAMSGAPRSSPPTSLSTNGPKPSAPSA